MQTLRYTRKRRKISISGTKELTRKYLTKMNIWEKEYDS